MEEEKSACGVVGRISRSRAKCPFLIECSETQFPPLTGRSHRNAADHHRGTLVHADLAYSDDQQNERGRVAYAPRRCPSVVRVAAAQPPHVFGGGRRVPSPPPRSLPSSTLFSVPGEEEEEAPVGRQDPRRSRAGQRLVRPAKVTGRPGGKLGADDAGTLTKPSPGS